VSRIDVSITAQTGRAYVPFLQRNVIRAYVALSRAVRPPGGLPLRELSVALVGDRHMSELHQEFMSLPGPTDVLTFPLETDAKGRATSGEVVVCVPEARRQAKLRKIPPRAELLLYALHGMLHLLGYDDKTDRAYRVMHRIEDELMMKLGLGPVFARPVAPSRRFPRGGRR
jgi:probable rRNA maturation factor